jgi:AcrR family transcriptional regulator
VSSKPSSTKEKILLGSLELLNERGFAAVTVADLAAQAGISTGNLSYHFPTKRDLLLALWDRAEKRHLALAAEWRPETVLAELPGWIRALCHVMWDFRFLYRDVDQYLPLAPELARRSRETLIRVGRDQVQACLGAMVEAGHARLPEATLTAVATNGWVVLRYWIDFLVEARGLRRIGRADVEELVAQYVALVSPHLTPGARRQLERGLG